MNSSLNELALFGGSPVRPQGPPSWPPEDDDILLALQQAYHNGSWGKYQGGHVTQLEEKLREYHQCEFAITCSSGTLAVELALRGLKVGSGDQVIMAGYDYPGNFLSVHAVGAQPVLVDISAQNWNLNPGKVFQAITSKTRAIIVSHLHGGLVPMRRLMEFADANRLGVIEDAAQCPGAMIEGKKAGTWGDVGILSFGGSKLLTAGRGGAILTRQPGLAQRIRLALTRGNIVGPLSELQAAVLLPQLEKLDERNALRKKNVQRLTELLADIPGLQIFENEMENCSPAYYKLGFRFFAEQFGLDRSGLVGFLRAEGIAIDEGFRALHFGRSPTRFQMGTELNQVDKAHVGALILHHPILLENETSMEEIYLAFKKIRRNADQLHQKPNP